MALFVHEFVDYPNLKNHDNGWWEFDENTQKVYNRNGGWHELHYHPMNEFKEMTWDEVIAMDVRDDTCYTGWVSPDGTWYGCEPMDHELMARCYFKTTEEKLENEGWIKVTEIPSYLLAMAPDVYPDRYEYHFFNPYGYITKAQEKTLAEHGIELTEYDRKYNLK